MTMYVVIDDTLNYLVFFLEVVQKRVGDGCHRINLRPTQTIFNTKINPPPILGKGVLFVELLHSNCW